MMNTGRLSPSGSYTKGGSMSERSQMEMDLDNLIRRTLRVSDPYNEVEVAEALGKRYEFERLEMEREASGTMFVPNQAVQCVPGVDGSSNAELDQAKTDVERDMKALINDNLVKDIQPELRGWSSAIDSAITDGVNAARFSLDPQQRNQAFRCRRILNDYARVARYVGALTPNMNMSYRRLAQSLDEVASVLLVMMGEALAKIGNAGGRFLMQVSASDLQERRDAVIYALRTFIGTRQSSASQNEWPRGVVSYRQFMEKLNESGQGDLRSLLQENVLSKIMDELIDRAAPANTEGLRSLGATSVIGLEGFRRLISFGQHVVSPESPPLVTFLSSLQLFLDAFSNAASGYRMLFISRPPIVYYGLYGLGRPDDASYRLLSLVIARGCLAEMLDCYMGCECGSEKAACQIKLDKILYDVDRSIDLYVQGTDAGGRGAPERRAAAYGFLIAGLLDAEASAAKEASGGGNKKCMEEKSDKGAAGNNSNQKSPVTSCPASMKTLLETIKDNLWHETFTVPSDIKWSNGYSYKWVVAKEDCTKNPVVYDSRPANMTTETIMISDVQHWLCNALDTSVCLENEVGTIDDWEIVTSEVGTLEQLLQSLRQELCVQLDSENKWQSMLQTMAPSCIRFEDGSMHATRTLIENAIKQLSPDTDKRCPIFVPNIPPTIETSLDSIVDDIDRMGNNRP